MEKKNLIRRELPDRLSQDQIVTVGDLGDFGKDLLKDFKAMLMNFPQSPMKRWVKGYELKKIINISPGTLRTLRNNGSLPFTWLGGTPYYDLNELNRLLSEGALKELEKKKQVNSK